MIEETTEKKEIKSKSKSKLGEIFSWTPLAGGFLVLAIVLIFVTVLFLNMMYPTYPTTTVDVIIDERIVLDSRGYPVYLLKCHFENGTEILLILNYDSLSSHGNQAEYYQLVSVEIGSQWLYTLKLAFRDDVYKVIDLISIHDTTNV